MQLGTIAHIHLRTILSVGGVNGVVIHDGRELLQRLGTDSIEPVDGFILDNTRVVVPDFAPAVHILLTLITSGVANHPPTEVIQQ